MYERPAAAPSPIDPPVIPEALEPLRARIESLLAPAVALLPEPTARGRTHFGGQPLGAPGARWPRSPARPMSFIGQIDLAEVSDETLPPSGLLQLFYDVEEQKWGFDAADKDWWRVTYIPDTEPLVPLPVPAERFPAFERTALAARHYLSVPSPFDLGWSAAPDADGGGLDEAYLDAYRDFLGEWQAFVFGHDGQAHQLLGCADWVQGDAREEAESFRRTEERDPLDPSDWRLLLQVASDDSLGFMWGDLGYLYLMARPSDTRRGDFSRCHLTLQCD